MRIRLAAFGLGVILLVLLPAGIARAGVQLEPARLTARADAITVRGNPVPVHVRLQDATGRPIGGATIRLLASITFLGSERQEVVDEAVTDASGRAVLSFSPAEPGTARVTARWEGDTQHRPADTSLAFDVERPVVAYHPAPVGIQAPWARSTLILVPVLGVWITYVVVLGTIRRIRRLGPPASGAAS